MRLGGHERLIAVCVSTVFVMAGQGVISPILPLYAKSFGVSTAVVGLTVTAFGLARLVTNVPAGLFADRRGRRALLVGGPAITAIGMAGSGLAGSIWVLLIFRFIAGLGSGLYMTGAQIYLLDIAEPEQRGRYIATNQGALLVGVGFGPAIGGLVADAFTLATPFYVVAVAAVLTSIYGFFRLPETLEAPKSDGDGRPSTTGTSRLAMLRSADLIAVGLVSLGVFSIRAGVRQTLVPLQLNQSFGLEVAELGVLFTVFGVIGMVLIWPAGWAADRFGPKLLIVPTALVISIGMGIVAVADVLPVFIAGLTLSTIGSSITGPAPAAYVAGLVSDDQRGAAMGLYRTWGDLGLVLAPLLAGLLADATSRETAMLAIGVLIAVAITWFLVVAVEPATPRSLL